MQLPFSHSTCRRCTTWGEERSIALGLWRDQGSSGLSAVLKGEREYFNHLTPDFI
jgi:hypothetical protein